MTTRYHLFRTCGFHPIVSAYYASRADLILGAVLGAAAGAALVWLVGG